MDWEDTNTWPERCGNRAFRMDATKELKNFPYLAESSRRRLAVLRRCPTPLTMLAAALAFGLGFLPMSTRGDGLTSNSNTSNTTTESLEFTLTTTQAIAAAPGSPPAPGSTATTPPQICARGLTRLHRPTAEPQRPGAPDLLRLDRVLYQQPVAAIGRDHQQPERRLADHHAVARPGLLRPGAAGGRQPDVLVALRPIGRRQPPVEFHAVHGPRPVDVAIRFPHSTRRPAS